MFGLGAAPALAQERSVNPVKEYARVLHVINPHLADWQRRKYATSILANAQRTHVDPRLIMAIVTVESSWKPNAVSPCGARGLGQLMPRTAALLAVDARARTATVQCGVRNLAISEAAAPHGLFYAPDPSSQIATPASVPGISQCHRRCVSFGPQT